VNEIAATQTEPVQPLRNLRPVWVSCVIAALAITRYVWLISAPHKELICFIADDAFYELQIARHFLGSGKWSFDGGYSTTTGFHLLNVYLMSLIPGLLAHPWVGIEFWMAVGLTLSISSVFTITNFVDQKFGAFALVPTFLILTAPSFTLQSTGLLEYPYVILIAALYVSAIFLWRGAHRSMLVGVFFLGFAGSIARSDFGGLPFAISLVCSIAYIRRRNEYLRKSLCGLAGAAVGVATDFFHNFLFSGHFLSDSALTKALWGKRVGYSAGRPIVLVLSTLTSSNQAFILILLLFVLTVAVRLYALAVGRNSDSNLRLQPKKLITYDQKLLASCGLCAIILYLLVYGAVRDPQSWYNVNFIIPMVLVLGSTGYIAARYRIKLAYVVGAVALLVSVNIVKTYEPPWNDQRYVLEMAEYLQDHPFVGRIAGWNVGIVGFFTDGRIINLDGLINDQIYQYALEGKVEQYIDHAQIKYIVDFPPFIEDPYNSKILGFDGKSLDARLKPEYRIISKDPGDPWREYTLFKIQDRSSEPQANSTWTGQP
jgi:hypothetical protein